MQQTVCRPQLTKILSLQIHNCTTQSIAVTNPTRYDYMNTYSNYCEGLLQKNCPHLSHWEAKQTLLDNLLTLSFY